MRYHLPIALFVTAALFTFAAPPPAGGPLAKLPGKPHILFDASDLSRVTRIADVETAASSVISTTNAPFARALRIEVKQQTSPAWKVQLAAPSSILPVKKGDVLFVSFQTRCAASDDESGRGRVFATLQQTQTYDSLVSTHASPGREWTVYTLKTEATRDYDTAHLELVFHLGNCRQTIEIGGIAAADLGPGVPLRQLPFTHISYEGQAADAAWRQQAFARIENIRKGDFIVQVQNADGTPVTNAVVHARMTRHAYQFGTFIEDPVLKETDDGRKYRETVKRLFNRVTCPLYWSDWGWEDPNMRLRYIAIAQWAKDNGFYTRGHNLIWPGWRWMPRTASDLGHAGLRAAIDSHLADVVSMMKPIGFDTYDVVNEPRANHDVQDILGPECVAQWFARVHTLDPHPALGLNEYDIVAGGGNTRKELDLYTKQIRSLLDVNAPIGVIGVQCHMGEDLTPPQKVLDILDRLAALQLPIHATEFDIAIDDEQTQADYMRDFLIAFFSHPATTSLTQWGFWEGRHWIPRAALFDKDWKVRPCGQAYIDWVLGKWWSDETHATDRNGYSRMRVFLGDYEVTVSCPGGRTFTRPAHVARDGTTQVLKP